MVVWLVICAVVVGALLVVACSSRSDGRRFPPGPSAWPVVGHLPLVLKTSTPLHQSLSELSRRYGPIVGLRLGQQPAVVVSSPDLAKQILCTHDDVFADRPPFSFTFTLFFPNDIFFGRRMNPTSRTLRKLCTIHLFTAKRLRELEHVRHHEMAALLQRLHHYSATAGPLAIVDLGQWVGRMSSALILRLLHSLPISTAACCEDLPELIKQIEHYIVPTVGDLIPWLSFLDFAPKRRMRNLRARLDTVLTAILAMRRDSEGQHDDLLHNLMSKQAAGMSATSNEELTLTGIKAAMMDMMGGGIHTPALTLEWAMAELLKNPQCFHRLQSEIDEALGEKKQVSDADLPKLHYLKCVVKEVLRLHPVTPLLIPRISNKECKLHGYTLPANTLVYVNVWAIGRDEQVWARANEFIPERFEGIDIDLKGQHFELLPFGSGRRICIGLPLGLCVVEVTLANLVKSFNWELPLGETPASLNMDEKKGITLNKACPVLAIPVPRPCCP